MKFAPFPQKSPPNARIALNGHARPQQPILLPAQMKPKSDSERLKSRQMLLCHAKLHLFKQKLQKSARKSLFNGRAAVERQFGAAIHRTNNSLIAKRQLRGRKSAHFCDKTVVCEPLVDGRRAKAYIGRETLQTG